MQKTLQSELWVSKLVLTYLNTGHATIQHSDVQKATSWTKSQETHQILVQVQCYVRNSTSSQLFALFVFLKICNVS